MKKFFRQLPTHPKILVIVYYNHSIIQNLCLCQFNKIHKINNLVNCFQTNVNNRSLNLTEIVYKIYLKYQRISSKHKLKKNQKNNKFKKTLNQLFRKTANKFKKNNLLICIILRKTIQVRKMSKLFLKNFNNQNHQNNVPLQIIHQEQMINRI